MSFPVFRILTRHFFGRFFDREALAPQGDTQASIAQLMGLLAVPGAFFVLVFRPLAMQGWHMVTIRCFYVSLTMVVMGFVMTFYWDALFPDRRDYQILTPQPLGRSAIFFAKTAALALLLGAFLADVNFFGVLFWPGIDGGADPGGIVLAHLATVLAAGLFAALASGAVQGALVLLLRGAALRKASMIAQCVLLGGWVALLFLTPIVGHNIREVVYSESGAALLLPPVWFVGLYERLRPATGDTALLEIGRMGIHALALAAAAFVLTYLPGYRKQARKVLENPAGGASGPGLLRRCAAGVWNRVVVRRPVERAVFHFISQTIARSMKHRLFLAVYGGVGVAFGAMSLLSGPSGKLQLPLTMSFILVSGLRAAFNFPSELRANWVFQVGEVDGARACLAAMRKWAIGCAILPLFALMAPMEFASFPWRVALFHLAYGIALSLLLLEVMFAGFRKIPFTCSYLPGKVNLVGLSVVYVFGFTTYSRTMASLEAWLAARPAAAAAFLAAAGAALAAAWLWRARQDASALEYEDWTHPEIQTLDLASR